MNHESVQLQEKFIEIVANGRARALTSDDIARLLLKECKGSGLRWYDGENDKWKEIE